MPLQTLAKDFTIKLYGKNNFNGYSAEQVLTGWLFFPANWKEQPVIKIKDGKIRRILGIEDKYASYNDFITPTNVYKLTQEKKNIPLKTYYEADEKFNLIRSICSGKLCKIFPHHNQENNTLNWYSVGDILPGEISDEKWFLIKKSRDYLHEKIILKDDENASFSIQKIKVYKE